jgi:hypothetical protein
MIEESTTPSKGFKTFISMSPVLIGTTTSSVPLFTLGQSTLNSLGENHESSAQLSPTCPLALVPAQLKVIT